MNEDNNTPYTIGYCSTQDINGTDTAISSNSITVPYGGPYGGYVTTTSSSIYKYGYTPRYYDIDSITGMDFGYNIIIDGKPKRVEYKTLEECKKSFDQEGFDILPLNQNLDVSMWTSLGIIELSTTIPPLYNLFATLYSDKSDESVKLFTSTESHKTMFHLKTNSSVYLSEFNLVIISLCRKTDRDEVLILADENIPEIYKINKEEILEHIHSAINNSSYTTEIMQQENDPRNLLNKVWYQNQGTSSSASISNYSSAITSTTSSNITPDALLKTYKDMLSNSLFSFNNCNELGNLDHDTSTSND